MSANCPGSLPYTGLLPAYVPFRGPPWLQALGGWQQLYVGFGLLCGIKHIWNISVWHKCCGAGMGEPRPSWGQMFQLATVDTSCPSSKIFSGPKLGPTHLSTEWGRGVCESQGTMGKRCKHL